MVCDNLNYIGIQIDINKNSIKSKELREIQDEASNVKILVIPTNEEIEIAKQTYLLLN